MGLLAWLTERFGDRREAADDVGELVQVANVRAFRAPMIEQVLADGGVACSAIDEHAASTWEPMRRIMVDRADAGLAARLLADFHAR